MYTLKTEKYYLLEQGNVHCIITRGDNRWQNKTDTIPNKCGAQDLTNAFAGCNKYSAQKQCKNQSNT